jgi:hypothetical protein
LAGSGGGSIRRSVGVCRTGELGQKIRAILINLAAGIQGDIARPVCDAGLLLGDGAVKIAELGCADTARQVARAGQILSQRLAGVGGLTVYVRVIEVQRGLLNALEIRIIELRELLVDFSGALGDAGLASILLIAGDLGGVIFGGAKANCQGSTSLDLYMQQLVRQRLSCLVKGQ